MGQQVFIGIKTFKEGMNDLVALQPVGNYGLQATWKDSHDTGIYTWEMLRSVCDAKGLTPSEVEKLSAQS
jgi:DUF971 family protein